MLKELEEIIQYSFKDKSLLELALTHSSVLPRDCKDKTKSNERLEFIGDGFLDAIIGSYLYEAFPNYVEGQLTKTRSAIVCESSLARVGRANHLNRFIKLGKSEENAHGRQKDSIIADATEAVIGAIYMDGGFEEVKKFVLRVFHDVIKDGVNHKINQDYKSLLQEELQKEGNFLGTEYVLDREEGPDHDKLFYVSLVHRGKVIGRGKGKKKKDAEQEAAKEALEKGGLL